MKDFVNHLNGDQFNVHIQFAKYLRFVLGFQLISVLYLTIHEFVKVRRTYPWAWGLLGVHHYEGGGRLVCENKTQFGAEIVVVFAIIFVLEKHVSDLPLVWTTTSSLYSATPSAPSASSRSGTLVLFWSCKPAYLQSTLIIDVTSKRREMSEGTSSNVTWHKKIYTLMTSFRELTTMKQY